MSPDLVIRARVWPLLIGSFTVLFLMFVVSAWRMADGAANPARTFLVPLAVVLPNYVFLMSVFTANITQPPRFSATGFRTRAGNPVRYDVYARWEQIDRIWLNPGNVLLIRLRDPETAARGGRRLRALMRRNRRHYGAELLLNLSQQAPELRMADVREAVARLSGGTHVVERSAGGGAPARPRSRRLVVTPLTGILIIGVLLPALTIGVHGLMEGHTVRATLGLLLSLIAALLIRHALARRSSAERITPEFDQSS